MTTAIPETHCLDINVGYDEAYREQLIDFLRQTCLDFSKSASRGMWQGTKILRVYTTQAFELQDYIIRTHPLGDDNEYQVHPTSTDADRCMTYLPDYDTKYGYEKFEL